MHEELNLIEIAPGVRRLALPLRGGVLTACAYLIDDPRGSFLIEAGPFSGSPQFIPAIMALRPARQIDAVFLLDADPAVIAGLESLRNAGFHGPVVADWRTALDAADAGLSAPFTHINKKDYSFPSSSDPVFRIHMFPRYPGAIYLHHERSACLFTGRRFSSFGRESSVTAVEESSQACRFFKDTFAPQGPETEELLAAFASPPRVICPRFGPSLTTKVARQAYCADEPADSPVLSAQVCELIKEIERLRTDNFDLRSAMVAARDSALRDQLSGLYDRSYAEVFLNSLSEQGVDFTAFFIEIDKMVEINRTSGAAAGDRVIADVANFLQEKAADGFLFRWSGPVFLLVVQEGKAASLQKAEGLRKTVEEERRFSRPLTVSIAVVGYEEISQGEAAGLIGRLQALSRTRLKILGRRGGNEVLAENDSSVQEKNLILILDGDPISADYLSEYLKRRDYSAIATGRGSEAMPLMEKYKPEVVVADAFLPQMDAFQLRAKMLATGDLKKTPFILIVDGKNDTLVERAQALGIYHILEKPVPLREFTGLVEFLVRRSIDGN